MKLTCDARPCGKWILYLQRIVFNFPKNNYFRTRLTDAFTNGSSTELTKLELSHLTFYSQYGNDCLTMPSTSVHQFISE